ncbi:MAG: GNAT family N-acetyltransferase [Verrucomicrobia bacterium]|nr:GNAT family N-acetyltransferase [Verrucomicrobiota bacterium]
MKIRKANQKDAEAIAALLEQLGYPRTQTFLAERINLLAGDSGEELVVGEEGGRVVAVLSLHFIPQLAVEGPFARISYLCVQEGLRSKGIGRQLEEYAEKAARARGCDRMELHCYARRTDAHRFYFRQGYEESPTYLMKRC